MVGDFKHVIRHVSVKTTLSACHAIFHSQVFILTYVFAFGLYRVYV